MEAGKQISNRVSLDQKYLEMSQNEPAGIHRFQYRHNIEQYEADLKHFQGKWWNNLELFSGKETHVYRHKSWIDNH